MRRLAKILAALLTLPLTYLLAAWLLGSVVLTPEEAAGDDITVYLITNGVHTDLALPLKNDTFDWTTIINPGDTRAASSDWGYAAFGWGDRGFYVETPHWRDLKISTALSAVSGLGDSIIHVTYYPALWESTHSIAIPMPRAHYHRLAESIRDQFALHEGRAVVAAPAPLWYFLGPAGTFTEMALRQVAPVDVELDPCPDVPTALDHLRERTVEAAVVPIETEGERIDDRQKFLDQLLAAELQGRFLLALETLAQIVAVGALAQHRVLQFRDLRLQGFNLRAARIKKRLLGDKLGGRLGALFRFRRHIRGHLFILHKAPLKKTKKQSLLTGSRG